MAHVLGAKGAAALIATARAFPARAAALDLPEAAAANRALFYDRTGRPRSAAELYASLAAAAQGAAATDLTGLRQDETGAPQAVSAYTSTATAFGGTSDLRSLFQTDPRVAATDAAARNLQARVQAQQPAHAAPTYFPRTGSDPFTGAPDPDPAVTGALAAPVATPPGNALANPPLPPRRPAELAAANSTAGVRNSLFAPRRGP